MDFIVSNFSVSSLLRLISQCRALRFTDGKIIWVTVLSPNDISGLRRPNNIKFGTKVASSMRMIDTLRFLEKFFDAAKFVEKTAKNGTKCEFYKINTHMVAPHLRRNGIYFPPLCEWIRNMLPQTMQSTKGLVTIVTLLVFIGFLLATYVEVGWLQYTRYF